MARYSKLHLLQVFVLTACLLIFTTIEAQGDGEEKYLCKGECDVMRTRCNCTDECVSEKSCCADYQSTCLNQAEWVEEVCSETLTCPQDFDESPVILFSIDGFKSEYIYRNLTPNIWKLASCGVHAPYMRSVYPTKTFPNHYTIVTGLYPESHGIIDNRMYDHNLQEEFRLGAEESFHPYWWGGEPIWVTTSNQGKISACYFWPGSDVNITRYPDYYYKYDGSVDNEERIYQALDWLDLPKNKRPNFITLYMDIVDSAGHSYGPSSTEVNGALTEADKIISILMNGLKLRNLEDCVNIIILADHGMAPISCDRKTSLEDYGVNIDDVYTRTGAFGRVGKSKDPALWNRFDPEQTHNMLRCTHDESHWQSFLKYNYLPKRYHYAYNDRIEPVLLTMDDEWLVEGRKNSNNNCNGGTHGFDNEYKSMHALFAGHGPGFKRAYNTTKPFENIEVYNLMADLLHLIPAPNNGTSGSLYHVMHSPQTMPVTPAQSTPETCSEFDVDNLDSTCDTCQGISNDEAFGSLQLTNDQATASQSLNLLYSPPDVAPAGKGELADDISYCLLTQTDYVTAYDKLKKLPFYVSFTLTDKDYDLSQLENCMLPDPRLPMQATPCNSYAASDNVSHMPLYPPELSNGLTAYQAVFTTNQVPMFQSAATVWRYMTRTLAQWARDYRGINVVAGPAFDYDYDGLADTQEILQKNGSFLNGDALSTPIPTHYFLVVTRCSESCVEVTNCHMSPDQLEVLSFIIPNYADEPCHTAEQNEADWIPGTLVEHVARVRDVELLTGLSFYTLWTHNIDQSTSDERLSALRLKLRLPQFSGEWLSNFMGKSSPVPCGGVIPSLNYSLKISLAFLLLQTLLQSLSIL